MIIVGNKEDLLTKGSNQYKMVQEYFDSLQKQSINSITVSSSKFAHVKGVIEMIRGICSALLKNPTYFTIPHIYKRVGLEIKAKKEAGMYFLGNWKLHCLFTDAIELKAFFQSQAQANACLSFLHNIGFIVYNPRMSKICTDPPYLATIMACFVFYPEHDQKLFGSFQGKILVP